MTDKTPIEPHNLDAEEAVLGSILIDPDAIVKLADVLDPDGEDFYQQRHSMIYQAAVSLFEERSAVDLVTVTNRLMDWELLEDVGGSSYLLALSTATLTAAHVLDYASILKQHRLHRSLIALGDEMKLTGYRGLNGQLPELQRKWLDITQDTTEPPRILTSLDIPNLPKTAFVIESILPEGGRLIIGGKPKAGKTYSVIQLGCALASGGDFLGLKVARPYRVLLVNTDMPESQYLDRLAKCEQNFDLAPGQVHTWRPWPPLRLDTPGGVALLSRVIRDTQAEFLGLDCFRRLHSQEEDSSTAMQALCDALEFLMADAGLVALVGAHHTRKRAPAMPSPEDLRGSSALMGWVDGAMMLGEHDRGRRAEFTLRYDSIPGLLLRLDEDRAFMDYEPFEEGGAISGKMVAELILRSHQNRMRRKDFISALVQENIPERTAVRTLSILQRDGIVDLQPTTNPAAHYNEKDVILVRASGMNEFQ